MGDITCIGWNIHRARGADGVVDPARTASTLRDEVCMTRPDVLILQEADEEVRPHRGILDLGTVEAGTGLRSVHEPAATRWSPESHGFLGVIVFVAPDFGIDEVTLLDLPGHCHRGAVIVDVRRRNIAFRLVATHLSLSQALRVAQMRTIGQHLMRRAPRPVVLCGDLNEWRPWGGLALSPRIVGMRMSGPAKRTFPARRPLLPLDRILAGAGASVVATQVIDGPGIHETSDHRPLLGRVQIGQRDAPPHRA